MLDDLSRGVLEYGRCLPESELHYIEVSHLRLGSPVLATKLQANGTLLFFFSCFFFSLGQQNEVFLADDDVKTLYTLSDLTLFIQAR